MRVEKRTTKGGRDRWRVVVRRAGSPLLTRTFGSYTDAEEWGVSQENRILRERAGLSAPASRMTLGELLDRYEKRQEVPSWRRGHLREWRERLGHHRAAAIRPRAIRAELDDMDCGPGTRNRKLSSLSVVYRWALESEYVSTNPCASVRRAREPRGRIRWLTDDERERLLAACRQRDAERDAMVEQQEGRVEEASGPFLAAWVLVLLWTGGRRQSEAGRLRWRDIDFERGLVHYAAPAKGGTPRSVPAPPEVFEALRGIGVGEPDDRVFSHWPARSWRGAVRAAGIQDLRPHDLRHSFCTWLVQRGVPLADVQQLAGHRTISTTMRYAHLASSDTHERVRAALSQHAAPPARVLPWPKG